MPEIIFKGKEYVYNHHLTVPYRPLLADKAKGIGPEDLNSNLIIHGDNLHALKALLPRYAGAVDLVFIDPPYNTGNEGWCYNDNVNSPIMKEWLSTNPVDGEDMLRHDKWLCMMWPRLVLLRELMSDSGSIWITLDDNEVHRARMLLDEIFGDSNFASTITWHKRISPANDAKLFSGDHDSILVYAKDIQRWQPNRMEYEDSQLANFSNPDDDARGSWNSAAYTCAKTSDERPNLYYPIVNPNTGKEVWPSKSRVWAYERSTHERNVAENLLWWGKEGTATMPRIKKFLDGRKGVVPRDVWTHEFAGHNQESNIELSQVMGDNAFSTPKPLRLIERILQFGSSPDSIVLDSFAGSGTTAHAVLKANAKDGGRRKFILVEGEAYADKLTAERVRRAIKGYAWVGNRHEVLLEEKINFTQFKKADQWLARIEAIKVKEGFAEESAQMELGGWVAGRSAQVKEESAQRSGDTEQNALPPSRPAGSTKAAPTAPKKKRFDKLNVELKDGILKVEGEKRISERVEGLGGEFTYCTLGEPLDIEKLLSGESLPAFHALGAWLFHTATGGTLLPAPKDAPPYYLGEAKDAHVWLVYEPQLNFLKSPDAALTLSRAKGFVEWGRTSGKRHLVFAPAKYLSNKQLLQLGVDYAPLPFALYREG
jgi:adenine-specific DNA-methyltransferase